MGNIAHDTVKRKNSDPRFRNGAPRLDPSPQQAAANRLVTFRQSYPPAHGWKYDHWNVEYDQPVYTRDDGDGLRLMYDAANCHWLVQFVEGDMAVYTGPMAQITVDAVKEECSRHSTRSRQSQWEAAWDGGDGPESYGLGGWY